MSPIDSPRESCSSSPRRTIGVAAELGDADLEGDPRPGRGLLEDERDAAAGERVGARRRRAARLSARAPRSSSLPSSNAPSSSPVRKSALQAADTTARAAHRHRPGTSSTGATSRPTRRSSPGARGCCASSERNATHVQVNRDLIDEFADRARRRRVGRGAAAGVPAALRRAAGRAPAAPRRTASLTSRNSLGAAARRCWPASTRT